MATQPQPHIAQELLARAHSPDTVETIFAQRVTQKPLLLRPTSPDRAADARAKRQAERLKKARAQRKSKKPRPLSAKQKRALCLNEIAKEQRKYTLYEPLHALWCEYMQEILNLRDGKKTSIEASSAGPLLASADYHGALIEVVRSRCASRAGLKGIVLRDTKFTFEIITTSNEIKTVPKEHTIFRFDVPFTDQERKPASFEIIGEQFMARAPDRATKKFRLHISQDY